MSSECDFNKALSWDSYVVNGVSYRPFAWILEFDEEFEPPCVPVWVFPAWLPPHFYHSFVLNLLMAPIGKYIRPNNSTTCVTRTNGARVCLEIDSSKDPLPYFWIGRPGLQGSRRQEIIFETLPAYCL